MKKTVLVCASAVLAGTLLSGCGWFSKANGIILYGDEAQVEEAVKLEENGLAGDNDKKMNMTDEKQYPFKLVEDDGKRVMVLNEKTAQALAEMELLREVTKGSKTEPISRVPDLSKGEAVLYAKREQEKLNLGGSDLQADFGGNWIIGDGRAFVDKFLIVDDSDWKEMAGEEKTMAVMEYDKDPSVRLSEFDVDGSQLVKIEG